MCVHPAPLHPIVSVGTFIKWGIDFTTYKPPSIASHNYIIVVVDYFTKWEAMPTYANDSKIAALFMFNPIIALANQCAEKSSSESTFNSALSTIQPPSPVSDDTSLLATGNTIPASLLTAANSVSPPTEAPSYNTTVTVAPSTSAPTTTTPIPTTSTASVTANSG
ncbi:unnamed protein product [Adineta steineri]|uniref:Integrase catalytic domain-containing protein n=1 Tax=Adineta steineri TaxID=433720 RepID=A0A814YFK2_9BILA|nr:unnamed protein product [Adineta steineri]